MLFANRSREHDARAYCASIGADPDEIVGGYEDSGKGWAAWVRQARWLWYAGVSEAGLRRPI